MFNDPQVLKSIEEEYTTHRTDTEAEQGYYYQSHKFEEEPNGFNYRQIDRYVQK